MSELLIEELDEYEVFKAISDQCRESGMHSWFLARFVYVKEEGAWKALVEDSSGGEKECCLPDEEDCSEFVPRLVLWTLGAEVGAFVIPESEEE